MKKNIQLPVTSKKEGWEFIKNSSVVIDALQEKYGNFFKINIKGRQLIAVTDPAALQHILLLHQDNYVKSKYYWKQLHRVVGDAMGTLEGEEWLMLRKLHIQAFTRINIQTYLQSIIENNNYYFDLWDLQKKQNINILTQISEIYVSLLLKILFGYDGRKVSGQIASLISEGQKYIFWRSKYPWNPVLAHLNGTHKKYNQSVNYFHDLAEKIVSSRQFQSNHQPLLIDILIANASTKRKEEMLQNLKGELIVYLGAGTETTAVAFVWTLFELTRNKIKLKKLQDEVDLVTGNNSLSVTDLNALKYCEMVIKEGMRMHSPSHAIVRDSLEDDEILGVFIPKGTSFFVSSYAVQRNEKYWPDPELFLPERFDNEPAKNTYFPFGIGKHACIGKNLAMPLMVFTLAELIKRYEPELISDSIPQPVAAATLKNKEPILIKLIKRTNNA